MAKKITLEPDEYIGAVKLNGQWRFFYGSLGMWILDFASYEPDYDPSATRSRWREGLLSVDTSNADAYCETIMKWELKPEQIPNVVEFSSTRQARLVFIVDFDNRLFINGFRDNIAIHEYAPSEWAALEDDPYKYIPDNLQALWNTED